VRQKLEQKYPEFDAFFCERIEHMRRVDLRSLFSKELQGRRTLIAQHDIR
jgi:hypothetical protein